MICPCRVNKEYDVKKVGEVVIVTAEREVYPECYKEDCPCYIFPGRCINIKED